LTTPDKFAGFYRTSACAGGSNLTNTQNNRTVQLSPGDFNFSACNQSSDTCTTSAHSLFSSSASSLAPTSEGHYDMRLGRATFYLSATLNPGVYYSFSMTIRNPMCGAQVRPVCVYVFMCGCVRGARAKEMLQHAFIPRDIAALCPPVTLSHASTLVM